MVASVRNGRFNGINCICCAKWAPMWTGAVDMFNVEKDFTNKQEYKDALWKEFGALNQRFHSVFNFLLEDHLLQLTIIFILEKRDVN